MRRILLALCAVVALAFAISACGSDDDGGSTAASTTATSSSASAGGGEVEIKMENIQFAPKDTTVKVGQKVKWVNEDSVDHNVKADSGADFASENFGKGGEFEFTADKAGTIKYQCTLHPGMTGTLNVSG